MKFTLGADYSAVPVLMFHSIGMPEIPWIWRHLTEDRLTFEQTLEMLVAAGYQTVDLAELYDHMSEKSVLPGKPIVLTFDDGYLDNWLYAAPVLKKLGMKATVYVTPEFVEESTQVRRAEDAEGDVAGFMNWAELRQAEAEGVFDIQSHALTHTWYFSGPKIVDFHRPEPVNRYPWMSWNAVPDRKPYYLVENQQNFIPWGHPIFEHEKSLVTKRFFPEQTLIDELCRFVARQGDAGFFEQDNWIQQIGEKFPMVTNGADWPGTYESESDCRSRIKHELASSKDLLESRLNKRVEFLAWPGGGVNDTATSIAESVGYKSWTLSSWQEERKRNWPGTDPRGIKRVSGGGSAYFGDRCLTTRNSSWVLQRVRMHQGSLAARISATALKLSWLLRIGSGRRH